MAYSKEDKKKIKELAGLGVELSGEESSEELETLLSAKDLENAEAPSEQEEIEGIPNRLPPRHIEIEVRGKKFNFPVFFVAVVKGGKQALYNEFGQRASPAYGKDDTIDPNDPKSIKGMTHIAKASVKFNAIRRKNIIPGDKF